MLSSLPLDTYVHVARSRRSRGAKMGLLALDSHLRKGGEKSPHNFLCIKHD